MEEVSLRESVPLEETNSVPENLRQTLLFVEDNEDLCRYLMNAFQTDYRVVIAKNGKVGLEKALEILPDVIVSDVMMPVMNGYEATKMIRSLDREDAKTIPIIAMTANAFTEDRIRAKEAGMNEHVAKPVDVELLMKVIYSGSAMKH